MSRERAPHHHVDALLAEAIGAGSASPSVVFDRATSLGIDATLYRRADALGLAIPPAARAQWRAHLADVIVRRRDMQEVIEAIAPIPYVILKGEPLAVALYRDSYARRSGDIDLLVSWEDVGAVAHALSALGYAPLHEDRPKPWLYDQWAWRCPRRARAVEIHWGIAPPEVPTPSIDVLLSDRESIILPGSVEIYGLSKEHTLLHLWYHFHQHMGMLKGALDVAAWCDRWTTCEDRDGVWRRAREVGVEVIGQWSMSAAGIECARAWRARAMSHLSRWGTRGVLAGDGDVGLGSEIASFKTAGATQAEVVGWRVLGLLMLDSWEQGAREAARVVFRSPQDMARARGSSEVHLEDMLAFLTRPVRIGGRAWRERRR